MARRKKRNNLPMLILICLLAVTLIATVIVALHVNRGTPGDTQPSAPTKPTETAPSVPPATTLPPETQPKEKILSVSPADAVNVQSGDILQLEVVALDGCDVSAKIGSKTVKLHRERDGEDEDYAVYTGAYAFLGDLPADMGQVEYWIEYGGVAFSRSSGAITYTKTDSGKTIAEVINFNAETFDGSTTDDYSRPTNNYLPGGTVDYCDSNLVVVGSLKYVNWRYGMRTYVEKKNYPATGKTTVTTQYTGTLPDHNEMGVASVAVEGHHTILTLDSLWKAPFYLKILPQAYKDENGGSKRSYVITGFTAEYVQIDLCYTTKFVGTVELENNPLFQSAEITQNDNSCTIKLYLKKAGAFYGWDSYYNEKDQLCFRFLNPTGAKPASNSYGADLTGLIIYLDVGHGGLDGGTVGTDASGQQWTEAGRNLEIAKAVKKELESMGATVIMNRENNTAVNVNDRNRGVYEVAPDLCIALHHNALAGYPTISGLEVYYFHPFAAAPSQAILKRSSASGVYLKAGVNWHTYYVARETACPVVLMENGYLTNQEDLQNSINTAMIAKKAKAIAQGTADYFLSIQ